MWKHKAVLSAKLSADTMWQEGRGVVVVVLKENKGQKSMKRK